MIAACIDFDNSDMTFLHVFVSSIENKVIQTI